ncbi:MAG: hypothetical protein HWE27_14225 [Gammaproteobacteria bacterium]|nr:hypothetical protein [Gammaproteobacteria bacterium]
MKEAEILEYLTDNDGSSRDITFTHATFNNLYQFIKLFLETFGNGQLFDKSGKRVGVSTGNVISYIQKNKEGCIHGKLKSSDSFVSQIFLFLDWTKNTEIAVEISFSPKNLCDDFTSSMFFDALNKWWAVLKSEQVFVRHENASWDSYDPQGHGVFYHAFKERKA